MLKPAWHQRLSYYSIELLTGFSLCWVISSVVKDKLLALPIFVLGIGTFSLILVSYLFISSFQSHLGKKIENFFKWSKKLFSLSLVPSVFMFLGWLYGIHVYTADSVVYYIIPLSYIAGFIVLQWLIVKYNSLGD